MTRKILFLLSSIIIVFSLSSFSPSLVLQSHLADDDPELPWDVYDALSGVSVAFVESFDELNDEYYAYGELEHRNGMVELISHGNRKKIFLFIWLFSEIHTAVFRFLRLVFF